MIHHESFNRRNKTQQSVSSSVSFHYDRKSCKTLKNNPNFLFKQGNVSTLVRLCGLSVIMFSCTRVPVTFLILLCGISATQLVASELNVR